MCVCGWGGWIASPWSRQLFFPPTALLLIPVESISNTVVSNSVTELKLTKVQGENKSVPDPSLTPSAPNVFIRTGFGGGGI